MNEAQEDAKGTIDAQLLALYRLLVENIKVTDDVSFKLLGTVPLFSGIGSGALSLLEKSGHAVNEVTVIALSLAGAVITIGLFKWELRNIQKCSWFISRAANLERRIFPNGEACQFGGLSPKEHLAAADIRSIKNAPLSKRPWGKTQAEKLIYTAAIAAWFIPAVVSVASLASHLTSR